MCEFKMTIELFGISCFPDQYPLQLTPIPFTQASHLKTCELTWTSAGGMNIILLTYISTVLMIVILTLPKSPSFMLRSVI